MGASPSRPVESSFVYEKGDGVLNGDVRRSPVTRQNGLISTVTPDRNTLWALFQAGRSAYPDRPCFGYRPVLAVSAEATETRGATTPAAPPAGSPPAAPPKPAVGDFVWMTYTEVQAKVDALSSGMVALGLVTPLDDGNRMFGIFSKNRWEWVASELSGYRIGAANVPLYDTLGADCIPGGLGSVRAALPLSVPSPGEDAASFIIHQAGLRTVFCSRLETPKLLAFKANKAERMASLTHIVQAS